MRRDQHMSSRVHTNFQDKKIINEIVSGVIIFASNVALTCQNAADLEKRGGTTSG